MIPSFFFNVWISPRFSQKFLGTVVTSSSRWLCLLLSRHIEKWKLLLVFALCFWSGDRVNSKIVFSDSTCLFRNASKCFQSVYILHFHISTGTEQCCDWFHTEVWIFLLTPCEGCTTQTRVLFDTSPFQQDHILLFFFPFIMLSVV